MDDQHITHKPDYAHAQLRTLIFLFNANAVLLIKGAPEKKRWANQFNGLGGHITPDENIYTGAVRELREETGVAAQTLRLTGTVHIGTNKPTTICLFVFAAELAQRPQLQPSAEGTLHWLPVDSLPSENILPDLPILIPRVYSSLSTRELFHAFYHFDKAGQMHITWSPS